MVRSHKLSNLNNAGRYLKDNKQRYYKICGVNNSKYGK